MATVPVDPLQLTEEASLNGTALADLPGANPAWVGRSAYSLLASDARGPSGAELRSFGHALGHLIATLKTGGGGGVLGGLVYRAVAAGPAGPPSALNN